MTVKEAEKLCYKETLYFINQFGFNNDYFLEFLKYEVSGRYRKKPSVEMLRDRIRIYNKINNSYKKIMSTRKVLTDKNIRLLKESSENRDHSFSMLITDLNEAHSFVTVLLKMLILKRKKKKPLEAYNEIIKDTSGFNELLKDIELDDKNEIYLLNNFNRLRNILAHAPVNMIIEQVNETLLMEMLIMSNNLIPLMNKFLDETKELIAETLMMRDLKFTIDGVKTITNITALSEANNISSKELLEIIRESGIETTDIPHLDMRIDSREANKIQPFINKYKKEKQKTLLAKKIDSAKDKFAKSQNVIIFEADNTDELDFASIDSAINFIYSYIDKLNITKIIITFDKAKTHLNNLAQELQTTTKKQVAAIYKDELAIKTKGLKDKYNYFINITTLKLSELLNIDEIKVFTPKEVKLLKEIIK